MDTKDMFLHLATARARERLCKRNAHAAEKLEASFRRNVTVIGFSAHELLEALGIPHRHYVSSHYLPGRVVIIGASARTNELPSIEVVSDLLTRGGTAILEGRILSALTDQPGVVRAAASFLPKTTPEPPDTDEPRTRTAYARAIDRWARKYSLLAEAIANAV